MRKDFSIYPLLKIFKILTYDENKKIKVIWKKGVMCRFPDLLFSLWYRITGDGQRTINNFLDMLKIPKLSPVKYNVNVLIHCRINGIAIAKENNNRNISNEEFSLNFSYEFKQTDLYTPPTGLELSDDFLNLAKKHLNRKLPHLIDYYIFRFDNVVTDVTYKVVKKPKES